MHPAHGWPILLKTFLQLETHKQFPIQWYSVKILANLVIIIMLNLMPFFLPFSPSLSLFNFLYVLKTKAQSIGSCNIATDRYNGIVEWDCTTNVDKRKVSVVCLVDGIPLENCVCKSHEIDLLLLRF